LRWRAFDERSMFVKQFKVFSTSEERYQYACALMSKWMIGQQPYKTDLLNTWVLDKKIQPMWKFTPFRFGRPILPKAKVWDHQEVYIREGLK